jgi:hypothetical protein
MFFDEKKKVKKMADKTKKNGAELNPRHSITLRQK